MMARWRHCAAILLLAVGFGQAEAARVGVLANNFFNEAAADFNARLSGHTFTPIDASGSPPSLSSLLAAYDVLLVYADGPFAISPAVGDVAAAFANTGRPVALGTFYDQIRSIAAGGNGAGSGWGALEALDPNVTDGAGVPYPGGQSRTLNAAATVPHPLTQQVTALFGTKWAGGNEARPGTIVVAEWQQRNARNTIDPAIAYRVTGLACVIQIGIAPHYAATGSPPAVFGTDFGGDFYRVWQNTFDFAGRGCVSSRARGPHAFGSGSGGAGAGTRGPCLARTETRHRAALSARHRATPSATAGALPIVLPHAL